MNFPVDDWEAIPLDTYKAMLSEVKEKFEVITDEIISCSEKSIKCLLGYITFIFGIGIYLLKTQYDISVIFYIVLILFSIYNVYLGYKIIRLRPSHTAGLLPENVLSKDYNSNSGFSDEEKEKLFYYKAIKTYYIKIQEGTEDNGKRAEKYDNFFRLTLILILCITIFVFIAIFHHPVSVES